MYVWFGMKARVFVPTGGNLTQHSPGNTNVHEGVMYLLRIHVCVIVKLRIPDIAKLGMSLISGCPLDAMTLPIFAVPEHRQDYSNALIGTLLVCQSVYGKTINN